MKSEQLEKLRSKIIDRIFKQQWKEVWFFPEDIKVKGYLGTQDIIFLCLNPSYSRFPTRYDKFFYKQLKNYKFENAHITDLIKIRATNKEIDNIIKNKEILKEQIEFLNNEIEIIEPKLIVALGDKCDKNLKKLKIDKKTIKIRHYSSIRFPKNKEKFSRELREVRRVYDGLN